MRPLTRFVRAGQGGACRFRKWAIKGAMPILSRPSLLILAAAPAPAKPNPKAAQASKAALALVDQFVIPAYQNLVQTAEAQEKAWAAFAAKREAGDFPSLRAAYNASADSWANAQFIKTGPITLFLRYDRFAYWPEARNATSRALAAHRPRRGLQADA